MALRAAMLAALVSQGSGQVTSGLQPGRWRAGESVCMTIPGFEVADLYPIRSPLAVADFMAEHVRGRTYAEIGTRNGDVMSCISRFAKSVTAIEMDPTYCAKLRSRGYGVACSKVEEISAAAWPVADVYYWWPSDAGGQNELWLQLISRALRAHGARASVFIGFDEHWPPDMGVLPPLVRKYNGTVEKVFFDEGGAVVGPARASPTYQRATHKLEASLARPFFSRPGHWGVFLLARFEVGPELWRRVRNSGFQHPELARWVNQNREFTRRAKGGGGGGGRRRND